MIPLRLRRLLDRHPDPTSLIELISAWCMVYGASLMASSRALYLRPAYRLVRQFPVPQAGMGALMLLIGALLIVSITNRSVAFRCAVACVSGMFWIGYGLAITAALDHEGIISVSGCWCMVCGLGCLRAIPNWVFHGTGT